MEAARQPSSPTSAPSRRWYGCLRPSIANSAALTALVNNAATLERQIRLDQVDAARLARIFATNVTGSFLCAREAVRRMSTKHGGSGGRIVNVSSGAARWGAPGEYIDYAASKGAIDTMTVGLSKEVAEEGIRVNCVRARLHPHRPACQRRRTRHAWSE